MKYALVNLATVHIAKKLKYMMHTCRCSVSLNNI